MLGIRVGNDVYGLSDLSASELVYRLKPMAAPLEGGEPEPGSILDKLRDAIHSRQPAELDDAEVIVVGVVLEAWLIEMEGQLPADAEELRRGIASRLR
jgi:hypothetical protein